MKYKYSKYIITIIVASVALGSCKKDFLELTPRGTALEDNFYRNEGEVFQGLISVYDVMQWGGTDYVMKMPLLTAASDESAAGGSSASDQPKYVAYDNFTLDPVLGPQGGLWNKNFSGVNRANVILDKIEKSTVLSAGFRSRVTAEAKFLRAYFYFDLVRFFGRVPIIITRLPNSELYSRAQATPAQVYAQIETDLRAAITGLPAVIPPGEKGRVSQGAAKAQLAKVLIFQNDNTKMAEAATLLEDVNKVGNAYGYALVGNYADIFKPTNKFNSESILEIPHSNNAAWGDWGWINGGEGNVAPQFVGMRLEKPDPIYSSGWGFCPVSLDLVNVMKTDPRYAASIIDGNERKLAGATYAAAYQNTDYFINKYAPVSAYRSSVGTAELNWPINEIEIRLADTYLLQAEALVRSGGDVVKAKSLLTAVRGRVGLGAIDATLDNIYAERRLELAFEGHRFWDLVRTGKAVTVLGSKGFKANKNEVLPIPLTEIQLTKGIIKQNPGYIN